MLENPDLQELDKKLFAIEHDISLTEDSLCGLRIGRLSIISEIKSTILSIISNKEKIIGLLKKSKEEHAKKVDGEISNIKKEIKSLKRRTI